MEGFTHLATGGCPPIADLMLALAAEFRDVDPGAADLRLDELALPLFGLAGGDLRVAAGRLATSWTPTPVSTPTARAWPASGSTPRSRPTPATR